MNADRAASEESGMPPEWLKLQAAILALEEARKKYLRARGWNYTCATPGARWMWEKLIRGRSWLVPEDTALFVQEHYDMQEANRDVDD